MSTPSDRTGAAATKAEGPRGTAGRPEPRRRPARACAPAGPSRSSGTILSGRYLIERLIGEGGMGAVYQAEHTHMRKRLAVKVLHPEMSRLPEVVARFEREAMAAAHIDHPNVAAATDFGKLDDGSFFLVLEYVEGQSLREAIAEGRLELGRALHIDAADRERPRARARARHRAPRPQARERDARHARRRPGLREGARLRHREGARGRARRASTRRRGAGAHAARDGLRHARVHGARAGARPAGRRARRPLRARRR